MKSRLNKITDAIMLFFMLLDVVVAFALGNQGSQLPMFMLGILISELLIGVVFYFTVFVEFRFTYCVMLSIGAVAMIMLSYEIYGREYSIFFLGMIWLTFLTLLYQDSRLCLVILGMTVLSNLIVDLWSRSLVVLSIEEMSIIGVEKVLIVICQLIAVFLTRKIEKNRIEEEKHNDEMRQLVASLDEKRKEADAAAQAKTDFLANMSHEIRTPMNAICCATELLSQDSTGKNAENYLSILKSSSSNLLDIVNDILDFSKIDAGKMVLAESTYEIQSVLEDVKNIIAVRLVDKPIAFIIDVDPTLPASFMGDEVRIKQILINLLGNAVKFTTAGEIALTVTYERVAKEMIDISFAIKDTGCGITKEDRDKLFKKFTQVDMTSHKYSEGSGLGLSICMRLANMMGGTVIMQSEFGKGSVFTAVVRQKLGKSEETVSGKFSAQNCVANYILWEENTYYAKGIYSILNKLSVTVTPVSTLAEFEASLSSVKTDYAIVSSRYYANAWQAISKISPSTSVIRLTEIGENIEEQMDHEYIVLQKPVSLFEVLTMLQVKSIPMNVSAEKKNRFTAPEAKVLLVDDNRVNLKVAQALLETFKVKVSAVDSGYEAVELIRLGEQFDIIFMDHMMPGMDGIEATKRIRELENKGTSTPIIALTANAIGEVENKFFAAGMNDFIPKPIVMKHLYHILQKWIPIEKQVEDDASLSLRSSKSENRTDMEVLSVDKGLSHFGQDVPIYCEILCFYLERSSQLIDILHNEGLTEDTLTKLTELHKITASIGADKMELIVNDLMNLIRIGEEETYLVKVERMQTDYKLLCTRISAYLKENSTNATTE